MAMFPIKQEPVIKQEPMEPGEILINENLLEPVLAIDQGSSDFDFHNSDYSTLDYDSRVSSDFDGVEGSHKKQKLDNNLGIVLPIRSFNPAPQAQSSVVVQSYKQFWKAGDYEGGLIHDSSSSSSFGSMDHVRVHPKFLHSNATSHKWALGAFAELLDNSLDEVCYGATFVRIDVLKNNKDGNKMLLVEDNGGGMDPEKMRKCMSLGYSAKSKLANTIGQYGNGFKTSTMRLGADVIVFSQCRGKDGKSPTRSIGMLSYTFLRNTGKEDIVVPILDYERGQDWNKIMRSSPEDLNRNIEVIVQWSPYSSEADLLDQFNLINDQGTRVIIYNLWEDEQGELELDFDTDQYDIQIKGVNRDAKKIEMAEQFPNSRHYLTHQHSLRSYASILYLRLPDGFRIVLRGKDVEHHDIVNDMMLTEAVTYRPKPGGGGSVPNMVAVVTIGFVKDAKSHIDVQGFNVYHKNRLIKPFWRIWNAAGSNGRGIIGVLEANFVEPAHDKQGFERTTVLSRLEARLLLLQKRYWTANCHRIGYVSRHGEKLANGSAARERSPDCPPPLSSCHLNINHGNGHLYSKVESGMKSTTNSGNQSRYLEPTSISAENVSNYETPTVPPDRYVNVSNHMAAPPPIQKYFMKDNSHTTQSFSPNTSNSETEPDRASNGRFDRVLTPSQSKAADVTCSGNATFGPNSNALSIVQVKVENHELEDRSNNMESSSFMPDLQLEIDRCRSLEDQVNGHSLFSSDPLSLYQLKVENQELKDRLKKMEESSSRDLKIEKDKYTLLEARARYLLSNLEIEKRIVCDQLKESEQKIKEISNDQHARIIIFREERNRRDNELMAASKTIQDLLCKVAQLENMKSPTCKQER